LEKGKKKREGQSEKKKLQETVCGIELEGQ